MPVKVTLPVFVRVNAWAGSSAHASAGVGQFLVCVGAQFAGVSDALTTFATLDPLRETGEPSTVWDPLMVTVPVGVPTDVGLNTTFMVQLAPFASVVAQVPPAVARAKGDVIVMLLKVNDEPEVFETVSV